MTWPRSTIFSPSFQWISLLARSEWRRRQAEELTRQALPALVGGMEATAREPGGEQSLTEAIGQHDDGLIEGRVDLDQVDTDDGQKIVGHVFGDNRAQ